MFIILNNSWNADLAYEQVSNYQSQTSELKKVGKPNVFLDFAFFYPSRELRTLLGCAEASGSL